ncbi:MAG: valine--tRNA ligase, partial [Chloroflexi bacterium]
EFSLIMEVIRSIRNVRAEKSVKPGRRVPAVLVSAEHKRLLEEQAKVITALAYLDESELQILPSLQEKLDGAVSLVAGPVEIFLPMAGMVDLTEERTRLEKDLTETQSQVDRLEKLLASSFAEKAPPPVVQKERDRLAAFKDTAEKLRSQLAAL